MPFAVVTAIS